MPMEIVQSTRARSRRLRPNRRLLELSVNAGLSPNLLAFRAGVCGNTIRQALDGVIPHVTTQKAIADVFDAQPTDIWPLELQQR